MTAISEMDKSKKQMAYDTLLTEVEGGVALITLNRPEALNAFNNQLMDELTDALDKFDRDDSIGCIVITGSTKAFGRRCRYQGNGGEVIPAILL